MNRIKGLNMKISHTQLHIYLEILGTYLVCPTNFHKYQTTDYFFRISVPTSRFAFINLLQMNKYFLMMDEII